MTRTAFIYTFLLCSMAAFSQQNKGFVAGKVLDSITRQPISLATVTVFKAVDTSIVTYKLSSPDGNFKIQGLSYDINYRVVVSVSGYHTFRKEIKFTPASNSFDFDTINLMRDTGMLDEVVIIAERPPVIIRNDTIEFNAASFKTLPTALVEDLLRKLPGVQVNSSGEIMVNGKRVNRILVDGKTFFGNDPKMATKNLPANLIDKVQVVEDKEEIDRNITGNTTDIGKVINLTLKKGVKKGWFGKAYGGAGSEERYEAGAIANIFRDTMQLSLLGFSNNVNRSGFSMKDVQELGGFNRSGMNGIAVRGGIGGGYTGFNINNISFGGMENGINTTSGVGFNLNHAPNTKRSYFVQYFFGQVKQDLRETSNSEQFIADTILRTITNSRSRKTNLSHSASAGIKLKPDSLTNFDFNASFSKVDTRNPVNTISSIESNKDGLLSTADGIRNNDGDDLSYNHTLRYNKLSPRKKGRSLVFTHGLRYTGNLQLITSEQTNLYRLPEPDTSLFAQLRRQKLPNLSANASFTINEPINKDISLRISQQLDFIKDKQLITTLNRDNFGKYTQLNEILTDGFSRNQIRSATSANITFQYKKLKLTAGSNALLQDVRNNFDKAASGINMNLFNILPMFSVQWKDFFGSYNEDIIVPQITYLNPVGDNTDPLFIREANPSLKPTKSRSIHASYNKFIPQSKLSIMVFSNSSFSDNDVILARSIDERGVQVSKPINVDGTINFHNAVFFNKTFKNDTKFNLSMNGSLWSGITRQALLVNGVSGVSRSFTFSPNVVFSLNWNDFIEFRPEYLLSITKTSYTVNTFPDLYVPIHNAGAEFIVRWPKKIVWETNIFYRANPQAAPGMPRGNTLWNAGINYSLLKGDRGLLKLSVYDLLNKNQDFYRQALENYTVDRQTNILQRYFLLTFTYNIRTMDGAKKIGRRERLFGF